MPQAVLIAPFWNQPDHVGLRRLQAMHRWLRAAGCEVVVVSAGSADAERELEGGVEIVLADPRGTAGDPRVPSRRSGPGSGLLRLVGDLRHLPDPGAAWANRVASHPRVRDACAGAAIVLSTSPPESGHLAGRDLALSLGAAHVVDLQDGWLDEPLKPVLQRLAFRRWQEGRLEARILRGAARVLVTSEVWAERLARRLPFTADRITTLHSAAPPPSLRATGAPDFDSPELTLLHAGTFTLSHNARRIGLLLDPLRRGLPTGRRGRIVLLGGLQDFERRACEDAAADFAAMGWDLEVRAPVPREEFLSILPRAHGLLLLSASGGALPSKLFEYLTTGRPVLAVTHRDSAVWRLAERLPGLFRLDPSDRDAEVVSRFVAAAADPAWSAPIPDEFEEDALGGVFLEAIGPLLRSRP